MKAVTRDTILSMVPRSQTAAGTIESTPRISVCDLVRGSPTDILIDVRNRRVQRTSRCRHLDGRAAILLVVARRQEDASWQAAVDSSVRVLFDSIVEVWPPQTCCAHAQ